MYEYYLSQSTEKNTFIFFLYLKNELLRIEEEAKLLH